MHERRFSRAIERLRDPERVERMEVSRVVGLVLAGDASFTSVLDIGTGSGLFAEAFSAKGLRVAGVDANPEMISAAQSFVPQGIFKISTAEDLPFAAGEYDLAFMGLLLHETDDHARAMQEAFRVCKKRLAVLEWPYEVQEVGPGIADRVSAAEIQSWAKTAGFLSNQAIRLSQLILYLFDK